MSGSASGLGEELNEEPIEDGAPFRLFLALSSTGGSSGPRLMLSSSVR